MGVINKCGLGWSRRIIPGLLLLSWVVLSCQRVPPFSEQYSLEILLRESFSEVARIGPIGAHDHYDDDTIFHFIPDDEKYQRGFVLVLASGSARVMYYNGSELGEISYEYGYGQDTDWPDPLIYRSWIGSGENRYLAVIAYDHGCSPEPCYQLIIYHYDGTSLTEAYNISLKDRLWADFNGLYTFWTAEAQVSISGVYLNSQDNRLYICAVHDNAGAYEYNESHFALDPVAGLSDPLNRGTATEFASFPFFTSNGYYVYSADGSALLFNDGSGLKLQAWGYQAGPGFLDGTAVAEPPALFTHTLQSGHFLSSLPGEIRVYDSSFEELNVLKNSGLVFEGEGVGSNPDHLLFSSTVYIDARDRELFFRLYSITIEDLIAAGL